MLILALILLVVGGLIIAPLLGFMSTGLIAGQVFEKKMEGLYAADAGIEDAIWKIMNDQIPTDEYYLTVNGKEVMVVITTTTTGDFLADLLGGTEPAAPHADWMLVYHSPEAGVYIVEVTYKGAAQNKKIDGIGAWLQGTYDIRYDNGNPVYYDITDDYPGASFEIKPYSGGTAFIWEWKPPTPRPVFSPGDTKTLTFEFEPAETPSLSFGWARASSSDIWISAEWEFITGEITAIATDSSTGKQTTVVAHVTREEGTEEEPFVVDLITWEIKLQ